MLVGIGGKTAPGSSPLRWENSKMRVLHGVLEVGCFLCLLPQFPRTTSLRSYLRSQSLSQALLLGLQENRTVVQSFLLILSPPGSIPLAVGLRPWGPLPLCVTPRSRTPTSLLQLVQWTLSRHSGPHPRRWNPNPP